MVLFLCTLYLYNGSDAGSIIQICCSSIGHNVVSEPLVLMVFFLALRHIDLKSAAKLHIFFEMCKYFCRYFCFVSKIGDFGDYTISKKRERKMIIEKNI